MHVAVAAVALAMAARGGGGGGVTHACGGSEEISYTWHRRMIILLKRANVASSRT